jgi:repressor LexA
MIFDIHKRRKALNLTLEEVAKAVGVSKSTVKKWESGYIQNMRRDKIKKLAEVLNVSPIDILDCAEQEYISPRKTVPLTKNIEEKLADFLKSVFKTKSFDNNIIIIKSSKNLIMIQPADECYKNILTLIK